MHRSVIAAANRANPSHRWPGERLPVKPAMTAVWGFFGAFLGTAACRAANETAAPCGAAVPRETPINSRPRLTRLPNCALSPCWLWERLPVKPAMTAVWDWSNRCLPSIITG